MKHVTNQHCNKKSDVITCSKFYVAPTDRQTRRRTDTQGERGYLCIFPTISELSAAEKWLSQSAPSKWTVQVPGDLGWGINLQKPGRENTHSLIFEVNF